MMSKNVARALRAAIVIAIAACSGSSSPSGSGAAAGAGGSAGGGASGPSAGQGGQSGAGTAGGTSGSAGMAGRSGGFGGGAGGAGGVSGSAGAGGAAGTGGSAGGGGAGGSAGTSGSAGAGGAADTNGSAGTGGASGTGGAGAAGGSAGTSGAGSSLALDLCAADTSCGAALLCRGYSSGLSKRCLPTCSTLGSATGCPSGLRCILGASGERYCAVADVGRACTATSQCQSACLVNQGYCTNECQTGADCPNGFGCLAVSGDRVCVKTNAVCGEQDTAACIASAACDVSAQLVVGGCTLACSTVTDCPQRAAGLSPWSCDGLCRRPPDVFGPEAGGVAPTQWACNALSVPVNLCGDAMHLDFATFTVPSPPTISCLMTTATAGVDGDACADSCLYHGGCAFGFACVGVGAVGDGRVGLCLPSLGGGEIGAVCSFDSQCVFGYCNRGAGKCSRDCTTDGICPTGSTCLAGGGASVEGKPFRRCE